MAFRSKADKNAMINIVELNFTLVYTPKLAFEVPGQLIKMKRYCFLSFDLLVHKDIARYFAVLGFEFTVNLKCF